MPGADNPIPPRPAIVAVIAYLLLMNSGNVAMYFLLFGRYIENAALIPGASISIRLQWQLFAVLCYAQFFIAIGLLWAQRWARWGYVIAGALSIPLFFVMNQQTQGSPVWQLLIGLSLFFVFVYLLYRKDTAPWFASTHVPRPRASRRRRLGAYVYVFAAVLAFWSLNAIVLAIPMVYPQTAGCDKLALLALPLILIAEGIGKAPGVLSRLSVLAGTFAMYLLQTFLCKYASPYSAQFGPSLWQHRNWTIGIGSAAVVLLYLQYRQRRLQ